MRWKFSQKYLICHVRKHVYNSNIESIVYHIYHCLFKACYLFTSPEMMILDDPEMVLDFRSPQSIDRSMNLPTKDTHPHITSPNSRGEHGLPMVAYGLPDFFWRTATYSTRPGRNSRQIARHGKWWKNVKVPTFIPSTRRVKEIQTIFDFWSKQIIKKVKRCPFEYSTHPGIHLARTCNSGGGQVPAWLPRTLYW